MKKQMSKKSSRSKIIIGLLIVLALGIGGFLKINRDQMVQARSKKIPEIVKKLDPSLKLNDVANLKETSGIYSFDLKLEVQGKEQKFTSYMTKDGKLFFTGGIIVADLDKKPNAQGQPIEPKTVTCQDVKKADTANLTAFIVSDCPYGLQMQRLMKVATGESQDIGTYFSVKYIGSIENGKITSMHGDSEAQENLRQICIREEQRNLYWPYVSCYMKEQGKSSDCLTQTQVNQTQLTSCMNDAQKGLAYAQKDFDAAKALNIGGSPTLVINDMTVSEFDFGGRNVDALKQIICCGSNTKPGFCDKTLTKEDVAIAFSATDKGEVAGSASANCATTQ